MKTYTIYSATEENGFEVWKEDSFNSLDEAKDALRQMVDDTMDEDEIDDYISVDGTELHLPGDGLISEYEEYLRIISTEKEYNDFVQMCDELRNERWGE